MGRKSLALTVRIHVLAGCRDLLHPEILLPDIVAGLISPTACAVKAYWISPKCGDRYHSFLQDEPGDARTQVIASAMKEEFGTRSEPLLVLSGLLNEMTEEAAPADRRTQLSVLLEIFAACENWQVQLHGLALPSKADPDGSWAVPAGIVPGTVRDRIERLRAALDGRSGVDCVDASVLEITPDLPVFNILYNNALSTQLASRVEPRLAQEGWTADREVLTGAIWRIVSGWNGKGLILSLPLGRDRIDSLANIVFEHLLTR